MKSNIAEGYGRRKYKADFTKFLVYALSSNDETIDHLEILYQTRSLTDTIFFEDLHKKLETLVKK
ncbi:MAG: four helix bundle protein [Ferruginibacter sp.]